MSDDIRKKKEKNRCNAVEGKVVYVHSDNEEYHALYCNGKLISWNIYLLPIYKYDESGEPTEIEKYVLEER